MKKANDWTENERMTNEFEAIGFYLTNHPIQYYRSFLSSYQILPSGDLNIIEKQQTVLMAGVITYIRIRSSKKGKFANMTLSDLDGLYDLFIYDDELIQQNGDILKNGKLILCDVKVSKDRGTNEKRLTIIKIHDLLKLMQEEKAVFEIEISEDADIRALREAFGEENFDGKTNYFFTMTHDQSKIDIRIPKKYNFPDDIDKIRKIYGVLRVRRMI